jgi:spermidine synthase
MFLKPENRIKFSAFILGFTSIITQIILLREFLTIFNGNELITGLILANWMLLTGCGALLGKFVKKHFIHFHFLSFTHIIIGVLPILIAFSIYASRSLLFPVGKIISLPEVFFISIVLLSPFCILSGMIFTIFSNFLSALSKTNEINKIYATEALGSIFGGVLFNFLLIFIFKTFFSLTLLLIINFSASILQFYLSGKKTMAYFSTILIALLTYLIITGDFERKANQLLLPGQELIYFKDTAYGRIVVSKSGNQFNFYENGNFLYSNNNTIQNEENVHYAMLQHAHPDNVLLICGGASGMMSEILKYKIKSLDYIDQNVKLVEVAEMYTSHILRNEKTKIIHDDARLYLKNNKDKKYDVVLINLPDPSSAQINRYFTLEFFEELRNHLNEFAVVSISLSSVSNYMGEQSKKMNASLYSTLKLYFHNVTVIPGGKNYFIASNGHVSTAISRLIEEKNIKTDYVNFYYLEDSLIAKESQRIESLISDNIFINTDFKPVVYLFQLQYLLSYYKVNYLIFFAVFILLACFIIFRLTFVNFGLFVTGFSASSLELILIIAFQVIYGYTYQMLGMIITFFMAGLSLGSLLKANFIKINFGMYSFVQYLIGIFSILIALTLLFLRSTDVNSVVIHFIFIALVTIVGIATGLQYSLASKLQAHSISQTAASSYATDLLGSAIGVILVVSLIIPYFGIIKVLLIIAMLNFLTGLFVLVKSKRAIMSSTS